MPADDLLRERDQNIYNDFDFYQILLKDFLTSNEGEEGTQAANDAEDDQYLLGADLGMTQRFLEKRRKLDQGVEKIKKEVDRRASKHRKIRYVIHEKLVNFMTPADNFDIQEGRESIVKSLFGQQPVIEEEAVNANGKRKRKNNRHEEEAEDEIRLI